MDFLSEFADNLMNFDVIISQLKSSFEQTKACETLAKMLSIVDIFSSNRERTLVADDIVLLFEKIVSSNVISIFKELLTSGLSSSHFHILKALTYFATGPKIPTVPEDSIIHPSSMFFKTIIISEGLAPVIANFLQSPNIELREASAMVMGTLASTHPEVRDYLLLNNLLGVLTTLVSPSYPITLLRKVIYTISICCGVTHPTNQLPPYELIQPCFTHLLSVLYTDDEETLYYVLNAFTYILPGMTPDFRVINQIIKLLSHQSPRIVKQTLSIVDSISKFDSEQTTCFIKCGLLDELKKLLTDDDSSIRVDACETAINLAKFRDKTQALIDSNIVDLVISNILADENVRWKWVKLMKYITRGSVIQVGYIVHKNAIQVLCKGLTYFKEYDRVLSEMYKFIGPTYNFDFVEDIITSLDNIVNIGYIQKSDNGKNHFALVFDLDCVDRIKQMLTLIKDSPPENMNSWRQAKPGQLSVEQRCKILLEKVGYEHSQETENKISQHICQMILDIDKTFFQGQEENLQEKLLLVKCYFGDDIRVIEVPKSISFEELRDIIFYRYDRICNISYKDKENDLITLDNYSLATALNSPEVTQSNILKLYLYDEKQQISTSTPYGTPPQYNTPPKSFLLENIGKNLPSATNSPKTQRKRNRDGDLMEVPEPKTLTFTSNIVFPFTHIVQNGADKIREELSNISRKQRNRLFQELKDELNIGNEELEKLYDDWFSQSEDGQITKEMFEEGMRKFGITDPLVIAQNFSAFDQNKDGKIDFREFAISLSSILNGSIDEKIKFMFRSYDLDGSGTLSIDEVYNIFKITATTQGMNITEEELQNIVTETFKEMDENGDGQISFDEFKSAIDKKKILVNCLVHYPNQ